MSDAYLKSYEMSLELAVSRFKAERAKLLTKDGQPVYAPDEHQRREAALRQGLEAEIASAREAASEELGEAKAALDTLEGYDPLDARVAAAQKLDGQAQRAGWELQGGLDAMMRRGGLGVRL